MHTVQLENSTVTLRIREDQRMLLVLGSDCVVMTGAEAESISVQMSESGKFNFRTETNTMVAAFAVGENEDKMEFLKTSRNLARMSAEQRAHLSSVLGELASRVTG